MFPLLYRFYLKDYKNKHGFIHILTGLLTDFLLILLLITMTMATQSRVVRYGNNGLMLQSAKREKNAGSDGVEIKARKQS